MTRSNQEVVNNLNRATKRDRRIARLAQRLANLALEQAIEVAHSKRVNRLTRIARTNGGED